eukprot:TRINITY_DN9395_c0_g1_i2.p1 TRINITY_DN9395_c0_g1~~TRINITY_DN9395_c0_g1_i2.p1  ORF type:complete len:208 (+),score=38.92 TRINITY_DN9395_c0_g1_i2:127-750(+)
MTLDLHTVRSMVLLAPWTVIPLAVFIIIAGLGIMNTIICVVVDSILDFSRNSKDRLTAEKDRRHKEDIYTLEDIFTMADDNNSKNVSRDEFLKLAEREDVRKLFQEMNLPDSRQRLASRLFEVLDVSSTGELAFDEFLEGCMSLADEGKSQSENPTLMLMEARHTDRRVEQVEKQMLTILDALNALRNAQEQLLKNRLTLDRPTASI